MHPDDPVLPEAKMHLVMPTAPVKGRVVSTALCMKGKSASFVRHVCIDVAGTPLAGNFLAGQSFGIIPPGVDEKGKPHKVRLYSIASPTRGEDGAGHVLSTTPKRLIDERRPQRPGDDPDDHRLFLGVASNYVCDLRVGDEVMVTGPNGKRFVLPEDPSKHDYLFLATGTGIAPFRGMVMDLLSGSSPPCPSQIHLVMGAPYTSDLLYDDLFVGYAKEHANFHYHTAISRERRPDGRRGLYVHQYLEERLDAFGPLLKSRRTLIYICGLAGMQVGVFQALGKHGLHGYLSVHEELAGVDPSAWTDEQVKRRVRQTHRCMLEVY
jgi:ferredoxin--NADP+ reductase